MAEVKITSSFNRLFLDTCVLIYFLEGHDIYGPQAKSIFEKVESGRVTANISVLTMTELLTGPYRMNDDLLALEYHVLLYHFPHLKIQDVNLDIAVEAARIRGLYDFAIPDSLLLATALHTGVDAFITNDQRLMKFPELEVLDLMHVKL